MPSNGAELANPIRKAGEGPSPLPIPRAQDLWSALGVTLHPYPLLSSAPSSRFGCQHRHLLPQSKPSRSAFPFAERCLPRPRGQGSGHAGCRCTAGPPDASSMGVSGEGGCSGSCVQGWEGGCGDWGCCWGRCPQAAILGGQQRQPGGSSRQSRLSGAPVGTQRALFCALLSSVAWYGGGCVVPQQGWAGPGSLRASPPAPCRVVAVRGERGQSLLGKVKAGEAVTAKDGRNNLRTGGD